MPGGFTQRHISRIMRGQRTATLETWQRLIDTVNGKRFCRHGVEIPGDCRDCGLVTRWLADGTTCGNR